MVRITDIKTPLEYDEKILRKLAAQKARCKEDDIIELRIIKRAVDARKKDNICFIFTLEVKCRNEDKIVAENRSVTRVLLPKSSVFECASLAKRPVIVGFGPAGIFAALTLAKAGAKPIVIERGGSVDERRRKVENYWENGELDNECNVQFGEGGAGTFSDGKLTTGINDYRIRAVLEEFVENGAPSEILYLAKPHIGTDNLSKIIKNIRKKIISLGGEIHFNARLSDINIECDKITGCEYVQNNEKILLETDNLLLAVGHSARDVFELLQAKNVSLSPKSFSVGVRIEHLQEEVNKSLHGKFWQHTALGAADYKYAVHLPNGRSVYTFCMCPGGNVVASSSESDAIVTNGMSCFSRDGVNANSALLVGVNPDDFGGDVLAGMYFQREIEKKAFIAAGHGSAAPISLVGDFIEKRTSSAIGKIKPTYLPQTKFVLPDEYLPDYVCESLRAGLAILARKATFFAEKEAVLTGPETRSSSPIRINRNEKYHSVNVIGLIPCGEGAGYAGGIMSAAVDGIRCAENIIYKKI